MNETFRRDARAALDLNKKKNRLGRRSKGDPGYLISNRAELATAIGTDKTMVNKIIGPAKPSTRVKLVARSAFVGRIREALELQRVVEIKVPADRATVLRRLANLPLEDWSVFASEAMRR